MLYLLRNQYIIHVKKKDNLKNDLKQGQTRCIHKRNLEGGVGLYIFIVKKNEDYHII